MAETLQLWERPTAERIYMIVGWRQWADAGSISSGLPRYLIQEMGAEQIGTINNDGFYLFQIPGTHDLVRPVIKFDDGYPEKLETQSNDIYYSGDDKQGLVILLGDEPHMDIDRYIQSILALARELNVQRIIGLGGVYGELPYNKARMVSSIFSLPHLKPELEEYAVSFSEYHGGASIGSYLCRKAGDADQEFIAFYAFVPTYDFSHFSQPGNGIRLENDFMAWLDVMRRIKHMLKLGFDLGDLERKADQLIDLMDAKVEELDALTTQFSIREYIDQLADEFTEMSFDPLDDVWADELRRLFDEPEDDA